MFLKKYTKKIIWLIVFIGIITISISASLIKFNKETIQNPIDIQNSTDPIEISESVELLTFGPKIGKDYFHKFVTLNLENGTVSNSKLKQTGKLDSSYAIDYIFDLNGNVEYIDIQTTGKDEIKENIPSLGGRKLYKINKDGLKEIMDYKDAGIKISKLNNALVVLHYDAEVSNTESGMHAVDIMDLDGKYINKIKSTGQLGSTYIYNDKLYILSEEMSTKDGDIKYVLTKLSDDNNRLEIVHKFTSRLPVDQVLGFGKYFYLHLRKITNMIH